MIRIALSVIYLSISIAHGNTLKVRDSDTGALIDAEILIQTIDDEFTIEQYNSIKLGKKPSTGFQILDSRVLHPKEETTQLSHAPHFRLLTISAAGYKSMQTYIEAGSDIVLTQIMLDKSELNDKSIDVCSNKVLCGYIYDKSSGMPLTDVAVTVKDEATELSTYSNNQGLFQFMQSLPETVNILIQREGYQSQLLTDVDTGSFIRMVIDMNAGSGTKEISMIHPLVQVANNTVDSEWLKAKLWQEPRINSLPVTRERASGAVYIEPPASIRVGFNSTGGTCCGSNCATSQVYSLETYVQRGLDNEWISSWNTDSLKAGSIPYRSYGAWHVLNGTYSGYDICAGPCCQAFGYTGYTSTMNAAIATNGMMLELSGDLARSEYSAQNNSWDDPNDGLSCTNIDLSCGNGAVGSPSAGWPCLSDFLSLDHGCFGHGRGMSQWGSKFQADDGDSYADIVDFYYNGGNNPSGMRSQYASTPVRLDSIELSAAVINQGDAITIRYDIFNSSDINYSFGPILLGASLFDGVEYFSDPVNDVGFNVNQAGSSALDRAFHLNQSIMPGFYDIVTAIYIDIDGNSQISSADWILQTLAQPNALEVLQENDLIFRDLFEFF